MKSKTEKLKESDHSVTDAVEDISWQTTGTGIPVENVVTPYSKRKNNLITVHNILHSE